MSDWIQVLGSRVQPIHAIVECEYCRRKRRYEITNDFYCRGCNAPLPFTSEFQASESRNAITSPYYCGGGSVRRFDWS